jgi:hypothetical protein
MRAARKKKRHGPRESLSTGLATLLGGVSWTKDREYILARRRCRCCR